MNDHTCPGFACKRAVSVNEIACKFHRYRISTITRQKFKAATSQAQRDDALINARTELGGIHPHPEETRS